MMHSIWMTRVKDEVREEIEMVYSDSTENLHVFYYEDGEEYLGETYTNFKDFMTRRLREGFMIEDFQEGGEFED